MDRATVRMNKPTGTRARRTIENPEHRDNPAENFGLEVEVRRGVGGSQDAKPAMYPSGVPRNDGLGAEFKQGRGPIQPGNQLYREVIPPGQIGSQEYYDMQMPPAQYVDTVPHYRDEEKDPALHGAMDALRSADTRSIPVADYAQFQPRSAPIPRARQDEAILGNMANMSADPLMTDEDSFTMIIPRDSPQRKDLYGDNRDGMLHNDPAHPGFQAVQSKIAAKSGVSRERAGAILAASTRNASTAAHKANPRLNRVKG